jgi:hypothetical protein
MVPSFSATSEFRKLTLLFKSESSLCVLYVFVDAVEFDVLPPHLDPLLELVEVDVETVDGAMVDE